MTPASQRPECPVDFSFIVPVYNALRYLPECMGALRAALAQDPAAELIVVDNGSTDGSWEWLQREAGDLARLERRPGLLVGGRAQRGVPLARGAILAFIDADCVIPEDYPARVRRVLADTGAAATGCRYALPTAPHWIERAWHGLHDRPAEGPTDYINSGNLAVRRPIFEAVGGFDDALVSGEDAEFGQRLRAHGHQLYETARVPAMHLGNPKTIGWFFRKQRWHAQGMFGTVNLRSVDRPTAMLLLFLGTLVAAVAALVVPGVPGLTRVLLGLSLPLVVPVLSVAYRVGQGGQARHFVAGTALYFLYYCARAVALWDIGVRQAGTLARGASRTGGT